MGQVRVPRLVGDGMVLQREMPIRIWGFASPGEKVTVKFAGETSSGVTGDNGIWVVMLSPKKAGGPYTMDIDGINHLWLKNIMVGEVWVCAGGYNMEMPLGKIKDTDLIAHAEDFPFRQLVVPLRYDYKAPRQNVGGHWETLTPATASSFSVIAWLFAKEVYARYHVPIGLIKVCASEAPAEAWLSPGALRLFPEYTAAAARYADSSFAEGVRPADPMAPGGLSFGMLAPIEPYTVRGVLWWQGETNVKSAAAYQTVFPTLINDWRRHSGENDLPFLYVQLEGHGPVGEQQQESDWAIVREAQRLALTLPATGMAVTADLGETDEAHHRNLEEISRRLFLAAETVAYGKKNAIYTGPLYHSMKAHGDKVHLLFTEVNTDLIVKGGGELRGFSIAGADNRFVPARAITDGKKVIVWSDSVARPVAVRYGWADNPAGINLFNRDILFKDGLPAPPFEGHVK
jgi:sialate O-acetylesterase